MPQKPDTKAELKGAIAPMTTTVQLARGAETVSWTAGDITLFEGDVSRYHSVRIAATAYTENGGIELKVVEVEDPTAPIVQLESDAESAYQSMRTVIRTPGRQLALRVWVDECPMGTLDLTWGIWGRSD